MFPLFLLPLNLTRRAEPSRGRAAGYLGREAQGGELVAPNCVELVAAAATGARVGDRFRRGRMVDGVASTAAVSGLVGRDRELAELLGGLDQAAAGQGRLFLLGGDPGIGKTRLADETAGQAQQRGFRVAWGQYWEAGGAPACWPWVQSLRALVRGLDREEMASQLGSGAGFRTRPRVAGQPENPALADNLSRCAEEL